jgi:hypothetical protein
VPIVCHDRQSIVKWGLTILPATALQVNWMGIDTHSHRRDLPGVMSTLFTLVLYGMLSVFLGVLFTVSSFRIQQDKVSCGQSVVIPRTTERISRGGVSIPSVWKVLDYVAFEFNSLLAAIDGDALFKFSSVRSIYNPRLMPNINYFTLFRTAISVISIDRENRDLIVSGFCLLDFSCVRPFRYFGHCS